MANNSYPKFSAPYLRNGFYKRAFENISNRVIYLEQQTQTAKQKKDGNESKIQ